MIRGRGWNWLRIVSNSRILIVIVVSDFFFHSWYGHLCLFRLHTFVPSFSKVFLGLFIILFYAVEFVWVFFRQLFFPNDLSNFICVHLFCYFLILLSVLYNSSFLGRTTLVQP
jgi:hypothetical protein